MNNMLQTVTELEDLEKIDGDMKLIISTEGNDVEIQWIYTINNIDYQAKGLNLIFNDGNLKSLVDGWFLFNVGSTQVSVSSEEATNIAIEYANSYSWNAEGIEVTDFEIMNEPLSTSLIPHTRDEPLALIPYWYVILQLDRIYPGDVYQIAVGVWADTGTIADINLLTR